MTIKVKACNINIFPIIAKSNEKAKYKHLLVRLLIRSDFFTLYVALSLGPFDFYWRCKSLDMGRISNRVGEWEYILGIFMMVFMFDQKLPAIHRTFMSNKSQDCDWFDLLGLRLPSILILDKSVHFFFPFFFFYCSSCGHGPERLAVHLNETHCVWRNNIIILSLSSLLQSLSGPVFQLQCPQHVPTVNGVSGALWLLHAGPDTVGSGKSYCTLPHVASTHQHDLSNSHINHKFPTWKMVSSCSLPNK